MRPKILSKSNYLAGLQCPKLLWIRVNAKNLLPEFDEETKLIFERGHQIGNLAKELFPEGKDLPTDDFVKNLGLTKFFVEKRIPLFEPGFLKNNLYARGDILLPSKQDSSWDIYEVKSGSMIKDINIHDVSFQRYVYESAGLKINKCFLIHKNKDINDQTNPKEFFKIVNITEEVEKTSQGIRERINNMLKIINGDTMPKIAMGDHCNNPYECVLKPYCTKNKEKIYF